MCPDCIHRQPWSIARSSPNVLAREIEILRCADWSTLCQISNGLRDRLSAMLCAAAQGPFSDALGDLEAYLAGLDDADSLPFAQQIQLKAYVMAGWKTWHAGFATLEV